MSLEVKMDKKKVLTIVKEDNDKPRIWDVQCPKCQCPQLLKYSPQRYQGPAAFHYRRHFEGELIIVKHKPGPAKAWTAMPANRARHKTLQNSLRFFITVHLLPIFSFSCSFLYFHHKVHASAKHLCLYN